MKKRIVSGACLLLFGVLLFSLSKDGILPTFSLVKKSSMPVVVIDAGHGGEDPGKVGQNGVIEKEINLQIAKLVETFLVQNDVKVIMTRTKDSVATSNGSYNKIEDLKNRMLLMESAKADLVVSIHQNSFTKEEISGAQMFYYANSLEGEKAATMLQSQLKNGVDNQNERKAKSNGSYYLLKKSTAPIVIAECGFLSNEKEAKLLATKSYQQKVAFHIAMGILQYLNCRESA